MNRIIMIVIIIIILVQILISMEINLQSNENTTDFYKLNELNSNGWEQLTQAEKIERINGYKKLLSNEKFSRLKQKEYPKDGFIRDSETAVKIAEIYCYNEFGASIYKEKPFIAVLIDNKVWRVSGVLPPNCFGGVFNIELQKSDGKVLFIGHGK